MASAGTERKDEPPLQRSGNHRVPRRIAINELGLTSLESGVQLRKAPLSFRITSAHWRIAAAFLGSLNIILALTGAVLSVLVAAKPPVLGEDEAVYCNFAAIAAVCNAVLFTISARDRGMRYRKAHRVLQD